MPFRWCDASLGLDAALAGAGISLATRLAAADELARHGLVELFTTPIFLGNHFFWPFPTVQHLGAKRRLCQWLTRCLREIGRTEVGDERLE